MHDVSCVLLCEFSVLGFRAVELGSGDPGSLGSTLSGIKGVPSDRHPVPGGLFVVDVPCGATGDTLCLSGGEGEFGGRTEK